MATYATKKMETKTTVKWGTGKNKGPKWARTRARVVWNSGKTWDCPSWDYTKKFIGGVPIKVKSELTGVNKVIECISKIDPFTYKHIEVFVNLTSNLDTLTGDFGYHILSVVRGRYNWKHPMYFKTEDTNMFDIKKMKMYLDLKNDEEERERARMAVQLSMENIFLKQAAHNNKLV